MNEKKHFFSYSKKDSEDFAMRLAKDLKDNGFRVWIDKLDIKIGTSWDISVQNALKEADCLIVVLSFTSVNSPNVLDEVNYALNHDKRVVPILMDNCEVPFRLARLQYIDFRKDYNAGFTNLVKTLEEDFNRQLIINPDKSRKKILLYGIVLLAVLGLTLFFIFKNKNSKNNISAEQETQNQLNPDSANNIQKTDLVEPTITEFRLGQKYGGGIVFFVDSSNMHGLIAAPEDQSDGALWSNTSNRIIGNISLSDGKANTTAILSAVGNIGSYAAKICSEYRGGGFSDWYLPAKDQLALMFARRTIIGGFKTNCGDNNFGSCSYWSSTENGIDFAWNISFVSGTPWNNYGKDGICPVRAIRSF